MSHSDDVDRLLARGEADALDAHDALVRDELIGAIRAGVSAWNSDPARKPGGDVSVFLADWLIDHGIV